jgi:hypothetical protein
VHDGHDRLDQLFVDRLADVGREPGATKLRWVKVRHGDGDEHADSGAHVSRKSVPGGLPMNV